jgi:hypothetical protein
MLCCFMVHGPMLTWDLVLQRGWHQSLLCGSAPLNRFVILGADSVFMWASCIFVAVYQSESKVNLCQSSSFTYLGPKH